MKGALKMRKTKIVEDNITNEKVKEKISGKNIVLVGLGPHAKRIYIKVFKKYNIIPKLIVDLDTEEKKIKEYLEEQNINTELYLIPAKTKDNEMLDNEVAEQLIRKIKELNVEYAIISTEPKAHFAYLKLFLQNGINVLSDKPITVVKDMHKLESINKIKEQYEELMSIYEKKRNNTTCNIMCQRRFHKGYMYVQQLIKEIISKYNVPITYIDIYHCDGKWMMPHDYDIENHPYKYGYGKLFHSGYHFVDLLAEFIKLNKNLTEDKSITKVDISSYKFDMMDDLTSINRKDIMKLFKGQDIPNFYENHIDKSKYENYGEKDVYSLMQFKNNENKVITTANINLLQNGFSRRAWIKTKDNTYKGNGRVRHEVLTIQMGPLLNIQVHSYQSKEIKDRENFEKEHECGGLEHFDIYVFRNSELIGGKTFDKIQLCELYKDIDKEKFNGYNELSREEFVLNFLAGNLKTSDLSEHKLAMELLYNICLSINKETKGEKRVNIENIM